MAGELYLTRWQMVALISLLEDAMKHCKDNSSKKQFYEDIKSILTMWSFGSEKPIEEITFRVG
jgi:hypothetical protein